MSSKNTKPVVDTDFTNTLANDIHPDTFASEPPDPTSHDPGPLKQAPEIPQFYAHVAGLFYDPHEVMPAFSDLLHAMARASSLETITQLQTVHGIDLLKEMKRLRRLRFRLEDAMIEDAVNEQLSD